MLFIQENIAKLGGVKLAGQVKNIKISETAKIESLQDDKGRTKANQPTGYDAASITITFILEDLEEYSQKKQIEMMQRLFKPYGQKKAKLLKIVNEDCAARGISKVYFKNFDTSNEISESGRLATLELLAPTIAGVKTKKKGSKKKSSKKKTSKSKKNKNKSPAQKKPSTSKEKDKAKKLIK